MSDGRWKPGQSGNRNGRPPGSGEVAQIRAAIAGQLPEVLERVIEQAKSGDTQAARLLLERVVPPLKAAELPIDMPLTEGTLATKAARLLSAAATGAIMPGEAATLIGALASMARITETDELLRRIEALEQRAAGRTEA